ncbi:MAG: DUF5717 family protein [Lachnospiraceae bacterium]|nr:DUF5717 family protein [Lachnospiraceae bacterium]
MDATSGTLQFSVTELELSLQREESLRGTFTLYAPEGMTAEGYVYSSDPRMTCLTGQFAGSRGEIEYCFSACGMEEREVLQGKFLIISSCGEYELPYRVEIRETGVASSMGSIRNMFHFTNLARMNWEEAVRIFYSKEFGRLFTEGPEQQYLSAYRGLSAVYGSHQNLEEFLLEIHKKQPVLFTVEEKEILLEEAEGMEERSLTLSRSGWGYTFLRIETQGDFLETCQEMVTDHEFSGDTCRLVFHIDADSLHGGCNFGGIRIFNSRVDIRIPVTASRDGRRVRIHDIRREKKELTVRLVEQYCSFRGKELSMKAWLTETERLLERLSALDPRDIQTRLFGIQLLITQEQFRESQWKLEGIRKEVQECGGQELWCYYLYLTTLCSQEDEEYVDEVAARVEECYCANRGSWRIAWLLLHLSAEYTRSASRRWLLLEEQFRRGCISPVLYIEAWRLVEMNPALLSRPGSFEMQVLNYAAKKGLLSQPAAAQLRQQFQKLKHYSETAFFILQECYDSFPDSETLHAICSLLIKGSRTDEASFYWYSLGVEQELRILRLYEYYMMSLPGEYEGEIPRKVLMYFVGQSGLDYKKNALLYSYICKNKEEHPEYYMMFYGQIEEFVLEQIHKGRINKNLAYLYENALSPAAVEEELAEELVPLLFTHMVSTSSMDIRQVIVRYGISREEYRYPVSEGRAQVPLYSRDFRILLEDGEENRYTVSVPYRCEGLLRPEKWLSLMVCSVKGHLGLDVYMCESGKAFAEVTQENLSGFCHIASSSCIEPGRRSEAGLKLLHYYYEQDCIRELDDCLEKLEPEDMDAGRRSEVVRFLVVRGKYDKALAWMKRFGVHGVKCKTLLRLCSRLIDRDGLAEDRGLTQIIHYTFEQGKYDGNLLSYLVRYFRGTLEQLERVRKAAEAFEVDTYDLCERMLRQMLFTGSFVKEWTAVFRSYVAGGGRTETEKAFLARCCHCYFVGEESSDAFVFMELVRLHEGGVSLERVCKLALLKYFAFRQEEMAPGVKEAVCRFLTELVEEGLCLGFLREYGRAVPAMERLLDKTVVEYKGQPGSHPIIHYLIEDEQGGKGEYREEEMGEMYEGIYAKAFVLFFGERLRYYIAERQGDEEVVTRKSLVSGGGPAGDGCFAMINRMEEGMALQDYDRVDRLLEDYYRKEYMVSSIFCLK